MSTFTATATATAPTAPVNRQVGFSKPRSRGEGKRRGGRPMSLSPSRRELVHVDPTSQDVDPTSQDVDPTSQDVDATSQDVDATSKDVNPTSQAPKGPQPSLPTMAVSVASSSVSISSVSISSAGKSFEEGDVVVEDTSLPVNSAIVVLNPLDNPNPPPTFMSPESQRYRRMYITSDYSANRSTTSPSSATSTDPRKGRCKHGLPFGICTENVCCDVRAAVITRTDQRQKGQISGRKLVEYHIAVEFRHCNASIWHRYSGFRAFYELFVSKHGNARFSMFPRKHINKWSSSVTSERLVSLNQFLSVIIQDDELREDDIFKSFLSVDEGSRGQFYDVEGITSFKVERKKIKEEVKKWGGSEVEKETVINEDGV